MTPPSLRVPALVAVALALTACGGADDATSEAAAPETDAPATTVGGDGAGDGDDAGATDDPTAQVTSPPAGDDGPDATIPDGVPAEFLPGIGPVEVRGASLPTLEADDVADDPAVGTPAPVLVGLGFDGETVRIDPATDGPTMVVFLAHWCPHCNDEIPRINELRDDGRFPESLDIVGVSTSANPGRPNFPPGDWLIDKDWTYPAMADGIDLERQTYIAAAAYGVSAFPFVTLVDSDGNVVARWSGGREPDEIVALIAEHLGSS